jgi:hypothetical protein
MELLNQRRDNSFFRNGPRLLGTQIQSAPTNGALILGILFGWTESEYNSNPNLCPCEGSPSDKLAAIMAMADWISWENRSKQFKETRSGRRRPGRSQLTHL